MLIIESDSAKRPRLKNFLRIGERGISDRCLFMTKHARKNPPGGG
jgi:hypothetical protein